MPGPPPNPNARRRNKRNAGFLTLPDEGRTGPVPELPATDDRGEAWDPDVVEVWATWWRSPMATQWTDADARGVLLTLQHLQRALGGDIERAREFRLMADRWGLNPLSRLRLRWLLPDEGDADQAGTVGHAGDVVGGEVVALRAVGDDG